MFGDYGVVTYTPELTAAVKDISPRFGTVYGGTEVTLTGVNLDGPSATVFFDNRECEVKSQSETQIVCITSDKPYEKEEKPTFEISIEGKGKVTTNGLVYRYIYEWSDPITWGGDIPPIAGDLVSIPTGQILLFDMDSTEVLNTIVVEGGLIFPPHEDPNH